MQEDWDAPTKADLMEDRIVDDNKTIYDKDLEETQDAFVMSERRECLKVNKL